MRSATKRRALGVLASIASLAGVLAAPVARADSVSLLELTASIYGTATDVYSFQAPGPGTVSVSLSDVGWPEHFQSLSASISSSREALGQLPAPSALDIAVGQAGLLYACVTGVAGNTLGLNVGVFSLHVDFTPAAAPVPLPEALRLLLVGLGLIGTVRLLWVRGHPGWVVVPPPVGAMKA